MTSASPMTTSRVSEVVLQVDGLRKDFQGDPIFADISFDLHAGELLTLLGPSGVGKTTLFNVIAGLLKPEAGAVRYRGEAITNRTGYVAYMLQKDLLLPHLTILDNVSLPLYIKKEDRHAAREKAKPYFSVFGLSGCEDKYPSALSGGMRQRAAFLRTILFGCDVLLLDEPFSALDEITKSELHRWFLDIAAEYKLSTILITHSIDEALVLSDRVLLLKGSPGRIVHTLNVDSPRPRGADYVLSDGFIANKSHLMTMFAAPI